MHSFRESAQTTYICVSIFLLTSNLHNLTSYQVPEVHMEQISRETVSEAFGVQDEADASSHNISMKFSFDESEADDIITSTPVKCCNTSDVYSEAYWPVSFQSPSYSPVIITDSHECSRDQEEVSEQEQTPALKSPAQDGTSDSQQQVNEVKGVKIVGDNVDKTVKTRFMRIDRQGNRYITFTVMPLKTDSIWLCQKTILKYQLIQSLKIYYSD